MSKTAAVINLEEKIGKTVGRRQAPKDPFSVIDSLQRLQGEMFSKLGHRYGKRGVFRFKTHEEANAWSQKMTHPKKP